MRPSSSVHPTIEYADRQSFIISMLENGLSGPSDLSGLTQLFT